jgi:hypothetical protein
MRLRFFKPATEPRDADTRKIQKTAISVVAPKMHVFIVRLMESISALESARERNPAANLALVLLLLAA